MSSRRPAVVLTALGSLALAACFTITFDFDSGTSGTLRIELGAISPECADVDPVDPTDAIQVSLQGDQCHIVVDWAGTVVEMAEVRDQAAEELEQEGRSLADVFVTIQSADVTVHSIALVGADGSPISPPPMMHDWSGVVSVAGVPIVDVSGSDTTDLLSRAITVALDEDALADLQTAFDHGRPVSGSAHAELVIGLDTLETMSSIKGAALLLDYDVAMSIQAETDI
jgi:hypothetical protein